MGWDFSRDYRKLLWIVPIGTIKDGKMLTIKMRREFQAYKAANEKAKDIKMHSSLRELGL